jgi:hypothetical protein
MLLPGLMTGEAERARRYQLAYGLLFMTTITPRVGSPAGSVRCRQAFAGVTGSTRSTGGMMGRMAGATRGNRRIRRQRHGCTVTVHALERPMSVVLERYAPLMSGGAPDRDANGLLTWGRKLRGIMTAAAV